MIFLSCFSSRFYVWLKKDRKTNKTSYALTHQTVNKCSYIKTVLEYKRPLQEERLHVGRSFYQTVHSFVHRPAVWWTNEHTQEIQTVHTHPVSEAERRSFLSTHFPMDTTCLYFSRATDGVYGSIRRDVWQEGTLTRTHRTSTAPLPLWSEDDMAFTWDRLVGGFWGRKDHVQCGGVETTCVFQRRSHGATRRPGVFAGTS